MQTETRKTQLTARKARFASTDLKPTSDLIAKRGGESAAFSQSGKSALVERRRSAWRRGLLFVFITPPPLASGAGMQPGFERAQMCYYLRVQMHPDTFARWLARSHTPVRTLAVVLGLGVGGPSSTGACLGKSSSGWKGYCWWQQGGRPAREREREREPPAPGARQVTTTGGGKRKGHFLCRCKVCWW